MSVVSFFFLPKVRLSVPKLRNVRINKLYVGTCTRNLIRLQVKSINSIYILLWILQNDILSLNDQFSLYEDYGIIHEGYKICNC